MRIALFSSTLDISNGYGNVTYEFCNSLDQQGVDFKLFLPGTEKDRIKKLNPHFAVDCLLPPYIFRLKSKHIFRYLKFIDISKFNLIHSLFDFPYCVLAAWSASCYHKPFIMGAQGTYGVLPLTYFPEKFLLKWAYGRAKQIIVPSLFTKEQIIFYSKRNFPISIIHNGVNFTRFQNVPDIAALRQKYKGKKILLTVGGLKPRKGQDLVIKALPQIAIAIPEIIYIIVGDGQWKEYLYQLAVEKGVVDRVVFTGALEGEDLVRYFHLSDIYVHTPRVVNLNFEGFGIVYLEASACKKPIVATDAGGVRDAIIAGKTGLIVPAEDVNGIALSIIRILTDKKFADQLGGAGYHYAMDHDWSEITKQFISLYKKYAK